MKNSRELGLEAAAANNWTESLLYLNWALRRGASDLTVMDTFGEAAYRTNVPEALGPYQNHYKYPSIASHMARAFLMLGDVNSAKEFLGYAKESALKSALTALLEVGTEITSTVKHVLPVAEAHPNLYYPEYWRALSAVADAAGREDLVRLSEQRSKAFAYQDPNIHFNQALRMLGKGEFRAGWRLYDWRLVPNASQSNRTELGTIPMWEGEALRGKTLLVYLEQGLGDGIFALRYLSALAKEGAVLEVVARPPLLPLIRSSFPEIKLHNEDVVVSVDYWDQLSNALPDYWVYGLSIPYRAGLWRPTNTGAFLKPPQELKTQIQVRIQKLNPQQWPVYTVNWHGRIDTNSDRTRAFSVEEFFEVAGLHEHPCFVISLQKDATAEEVSRIEAMVNKRGGHFLNAGPELTDFAVTAAWIACSDRLLTCDTSVAHVGGALGHPTTVFARNKAIWQWLRHEKNPDVAAAAVWYDSALVQYALAPEISWLFTTTEVSKESKYDSTKSTPENLELPTGAVRSAGQRRHFRFAGRTQQP